MSSAAEVHFDPLADPLAQLDRLLEHESGVVRAGAPVDALLVLRRDLVREVLRDTDTYSSRDALGGPMPASVPPRVAAELPEFLQEPVTAVVDADGPGHHRLHATVQAAYSRARTGTLRPLLVRRAGELAGEIAERRGGDLVADFAQPLTAAGMAAAMGVPQQDAPQLAAWAMSLAQVLTPTVPEEERVAAAARLHGFAEWGGDLLDRAPEGSAAAIYARGADGRQALRREDALYCLLTHWVAGTVTTTHGITTAGHRLLCERALWQEAAADPDTFAPRAFDEGLRWAAPHRGLVRTVTRPATLGEVRLAPGDRVLPMLAAANRDPGHWAEPRRFDPHREAAHHDAFSYGPHACVGAHLARLEGEIALHTLLTALPSLRRDGDEPPLRPDFFFHGLARLPVTLTGPDPAEA